ncbi:MAG: DUF6531 domain-containing protein [Terriglobales bacterium]
MNRKRTPMFSIPAVWKWCALLVLLSGSIALRFRNQPHKRAANGPIHVKLLAHLNSTPTWDGAYPYVVVSLPDSGSHSLKFKTSILFKQPTLRHESPINQFEVDLHSGMFVLRQTDLFVADVMPLVLTRTYHTWDYYAGAFGLAHDHPYNICQSGDNHPYTYSDLYLEDGRQIHFPRISEGTGYADAVYRHTETSSEFYGAQITWNGVGWSFHFADGREFLFPDSYHAKDCAQKAPLEMRDGADHRIQLQRDKASGNLEKLISTSGHTIKFRYDGASRIIEAGDDSGNIRKYSYDSIGHLQTVADASRVLYRFEYERLNRSANNPYLMTVITDGEWRMMLRNKYRGGRVLAQELANGEQYTYDYILDRNRKQVIETDVKLPDGRTRKFFFENGIPKRRQNAPDPLH